MNVIVVANQHRIPIVGPWIKELNPIYAYCDDRPGFAVGQTRCLAGHQTALAAYHTDPTALVLEDDAFPDPTLDWRGAIEEGNEMVLNGVCDVVCLHGRGEEEIPKKFKFEKYKKFEWAKPPQEHYSIQGTLAYITNQKAAWHFRQFDPWIRYTPIDALWWSPRFNWMLLKDKWTTDPFSWTPHFHHGCGAENSILQNPKNTKYSLV